MLTFPDLSTQSPTPFWVATAAVSVTSLYYLSKKNKTNNTAKISNEPKEPGQKVFPAPEITPVGDDFNWETQKPYPYRPYKKGTYKMTLAIRKLDPNDILCIEDTYLDRVRLREQLFDKQKITGCHESAIDALQEAYEFTFNHMMKRYPQYFKLSDDRKTIKNLVADHDIPADPTSLTPDELLRVLASNIEEDMLLLIKNPESGDLDEYVLRAAMSLFPAGFDPTEKLNQPLTRVHGPVPGYPQKLQTSMNKFFNRLSVNEFIVRNNWSLQTHTNLCARVGSHATSEEAKLIHPPFPQDLDFNKVFFRVEKQCFTRLPRTKADLMYIRTYVTSLMDLRGSLNEEEKEILCSAIDGLEGTMGIYKKRIQWGDAAKAFIRGESDGCQPIPKKYKFVS